MSKYANKRLHIRSGNGRFRRPQPADVGIGGVCEKCRHLLLRHYDGDPRQTIDPRRFRYRCFTCEPLTDAEKQLAAEIEAAKPKPPTLIDILARAETINKERGL